MRSFYSKAFAKYSPLFPVLLVGLLIYGYILRTDISVPEIMTANQIEFWSKFGFTQTFMTENPKFFFSLEFWASILSIAGGFFLGMSLIGKTSGSVISIFLTVYPYYIVNTYSPNTITLFFFILFLFFQLQATVGYSKILSAFAGIFFMLSLMCNPVCLPLGVIMYIYQAICARNIGVLYNFLLFLGGATFVYLGYTVILAYYPDTPSFIPAISAAFSEFSNNFNIFTSAPFDYFKNTILPLFTETLAYPAQYAGKLNDFTYWHYLGVFSSIFGLLYSLVEEKARVLTIISLIVLIQAFFMPINFGFLFLFVIIVGSYLIDKVFHDVFC